MACGVEDLKMDLFRSLGSTVNSEREAPIKNEIEQLSVMRQSNTEALMSATQRGNEKVHYSLARVKGLAEVVHQVYFCCAH